MSTSYDDRRYWADQVSALKHDELPNVRAVAAKWQATLTGLLTGFTGVGLVWGPDKVQDLPVEGLARVIVLVVVLAGGAVALLALLCVHAAANGDLEVVPTMTGEVLAGLSHQSAVKARRDVQVARRLTAGAAALIVGATVWLLFAAATAPSKPAASPNVLVRASGTTLCGHLTTDDEGVAAVEVGAAEVPVTIGPGTRVQVVPGCG